MSGSIYDWSTSASDNDSADGSIDWREGMNSKVVNNSSRQVMGRVAEFLADLGGQGTVGGTANAITLTLNSAFTGLKSGLVCALQPTADNTAAVTLNVNGIGGKAIRKFDSTGEVALASGDLQAGNFYLLVYDLNANSAAGAWICLNPVAQPLDATLTAIAALAVTDGNIIVGNGATWVAESGATARASLGLGSAATTASTDYATAAQGVKADAAIPSTRTVSAGTGLIGGGDLSANRSFSVDGTVWRDGNQPTAGQIGSLLAAIPFGGVGTIALVNVTAGPNPGPGGVVAGSDLKYASVSNNQASSPVPTGTWRLMGNISAAGGGSGSTTLAQRIS